MAGIPEEIIEEIRSRCNIVDIIGGFIQLRKAGGSSYKGLCPFHQEKTPSFFVDGARQSFHCFGCGKGGDIFRFFMDKDNLTFVDAVRTLAGRAGVIIPENDISPDAGKSRAQAKERIYKINDELCSLYSKTLRDNPNSPVAQYLQKRNLPPEIIAKFKIGAAPENWTDGVDYCRRLGFKDDELLTAGVAMQSSKDPSRIFDLFRNRLVFTIENEIGRVVGFSARSLEAKPADGRKYVNSPETPVFKKSRTLYALSQARQAIGKLNMAILCEGQMDAIAFHRAGFECAVAPLGSAFTPEQAQILKRYTNHIILAFDADSAGEKAFLHATEILLPLSMDVKVMRIEGGKDPDELYNQQGSEGIANAVNSAVPWLNVLVDILKKRYDFTQPSSRGEAAEIVAGYLDAVPSQVALEAYIAESAALLQVSTSAVSAELARLRKGKEKKSFYSASAAQPAPAKTAPPKQKYPVALVTLLEIAVGNPDAGRLIAELCEENFFNNENPVSRAINIMINGSLNGEHSEAVNQLRNQLNDTPDPVISRVLITAGPCPKYEQAINDSVADLIRIRTAAKRKQLVAKLAVAATDDERNAILLEIQNLHNITVKKRGHL